MKPALSVTALALLISLLATACSLTRPLQAKAVPTQVRTTAGRYIVVTLRNEARAQAEHPGSTPRGYDAAGRYGVTASASQQAKALERDYGLREISAWPIATLHVHCIMFQLPGAAARATMIAQLANDRRVESVQPLNEFTTETDGETLRTVPAAPPVRVPYNDPYAKLQVSLRELAVVPAQQLSRGAGVQVAVIDTGMDFDHPDLKGRVSGRRNFVDTDDAKFEQDMHGTEVSGVIAAVADNGIGIVGIAPDARILALKASSWQQAITSGGFGGVQQLHARTGPRGGDCRARRHRQHELGRAARSVAGATGQPCCRAGCDFRRRRRAPRQWQYVPGGLE